MNDAVEKSAAERREYHRLEFRAGISLTALPAELKDDPQALRSRLRSELRMLQWLRLENQQALIRDSLLRSQPALAPLLRLVDAKLNFLAAELFSSDPQRTDYQPLRMSATGIDFPWPEVLEPGSLWLLEIDPAGTDPALRLPAIIAGGDERSEPGRAAAEFFALSAEDEDTLASWIVARQAKSLSRKAAKDQAEN